MTHIRKILLAGFCTIVASNLPAADQTDQEESAKPKIIVRHLAFKPANRMFGLRFGGKSTITVLEDASAARKLFGEENAQSLVGLVDFTKEKIVLVSWTTAGPPEGELKHEIKTEGDDRETVFYVQGPDCQIRGMRARIGADFFAVSKAIAVSFDAKERQPKGQTPNSAAPKPTGRGR